MNKKLWIAVSIFFQKMVEKLIHQKTTHGYSGWDNPSQIVNENIKRKLIKNIEREDWVDVANLAMMLDYRKGRK